MTPKKRHDKPQGGSGATIDLNALLQCATECASSLTDCLEGSVETSREHVQEIFDRIDNTDLIVVLKEQINEGSTQARQEYDKLVKALEHAYSKGYAQARVLLNRLRLPEQPTT